MLGGDLKKVYVCGPPNMNKSVPETLKILGYDMDKVMVV